MIGLIGLPHRSADHVLAVDQRAVAVENHQFQRFVSDLPCCAAPFMAFSPPLERPQSRSSTTIVWPAHHAHQPSWATGGNGVSAPLESSWDSTATSRAWGANRNVGREGASRNPCAQVAGCAWSRRKCRILTSLIRTTSTRSWIANGPVRRTPQSLNTSG